jgi:Flp pilus assembly protein protease CpaA
VISTLILLFIANFDCKYKRIPNSFVLTLLIVALFEGRADSSFPFFILSAVGLLVFAYLSRCGMGDVKLLLVAIEYLVGSARIVQYLWWLIAISSISIVIHSLRYRAIKGDFAFAPAICGAVLALRVFSPA